MDALEATQAAFSELSAGGDSPTPQSDPAPTPDTTPAETESTAPPATQEQSTAPAQSSTEPGDPTPLTGNIPVSRHQAVLAKERETHKAELEKLAWARDLKVDPQTIVERLKALELAENEPLTFLDRYEATLLQNPQFAAALKARRQPAQAERQPEAEKPFPEPNVQLEDGRKLYDADGLKALLEWQEQRIAGRYEPIEKQFKGQQAWNSALERNKARLDDARQNWEGFTQYEADIKAYMANDGRATLESAYRSVVVPKMKADRAAMEAELRKSFIAELDAKGKASTEQPGRAANAAPKSYKGMATADIVRESFLELSGR